VVAAVLHLLDWRQHKAVAAAALADLEPAPD